MIGLPDDDLGHTVHAIVQADESVVPRGVLLEFLAERVATYKLPRTVEYVEEALRDEAGKVRRAAFRAERGGT